MKNSYFFMDFPWMVSTDMMTADNLLYILTHWELKELPMATHICVGKLTIIGSDNGLSPDPCQAIIWINAGILLIWPLGTNFSEILIEIYIVSFMNMHLKLSSGIWRPFCLGLNVLIWYNLQTWLKQCNIRFHSIRPYTNFCTLLLVSLMLNQFYIIKDRTY